MENATDALKMAAAMLIFVAALSLTIGVFTKTRQTSAAVMNNNDKNKTYYDNINYSSEREVGVETVITNCYLYFKNYNTILFYVGHIDSDGETVIDRKMPLYYTESMPTRDDTNQKSSLKINSNLLIDNPEGTSIDVIHRQVYGLDISDERSRKEPWVATDKKNRDFITSLIKSVKTETYPWSRNNVNENRASSFGISNYSSNYSLASKYNNYEYTNGNVSGLRIGFCYSEPEYLNTAFANASNAVFIERIGTYKMSSANNSTNITSTQKQFVDENGDVVSSEDETDETVLKRVIQYIYIKR